MNPLLRQTSMPQSVMVFLLLVSSVFSQDEKSRNQQASDAPLVFIRPGDIPILLSAPHGGRRAIPDVPERKADGEKQFVTTRDDNTAELTMKLSEELERSLHGKPFVVIAHFERKYLDVNRPAEDAYEVQAAKVVYEQYQAALKESCQTIRKRWPHGLLLDIHGQAAEPDKILRGTANGDTVKRLVERHSRAAVIGPRSLFGALHEAGIPVLPKLETDDREVKFNGGHIVRTYGSHREQGLDAIQLELGSNFRKKAKLDETARALTDAVRTHCTHYLPEAIEKAR